MFRTWQYYHAFHDGYSAEVEILFFPKIITCINNSSQNIPNIIYSE